MPFTENNGVRLRWDEQGQGTPILLVMGHRYSSAMWYPAIPALAAEHRVIWFDNRGTGESDTTRKVTMQELAADAWAVADAAGVDKAHIYGVSMGGVIVQEMAIQQPARVTSLIVGCSGALTPEKSRGSPLVQILYRLPPWLLKLIMRTAGGGDHGYGSAAPAEAIAFDQAMIEKDKFTVDGVIAQSLAIGGYRTSRESIARLTMPALVLHGDEDKLVKFEWGQELAEILPDSRFVRFEGAGHNYFVVDRNKANTAVLDFTREVDAATGV